MRVSQIAENGFCACALVIEEEIGSPACQVLRESCHVLLGLLRHARKRHPLRLRFDHARRLAINEEEIIARAGWKLELSNSHTERGSEIEFVFVLDNPTGSSKEPVYFNTRFVLGVRGGILVLSRVTTAYRSNE